MAAQVQTSTLAASYRLAAIEWKTSALVARSELELERVRLGACRDQTVALERIAREPRPSPEPVSPSWFWPVVLGSAVASVVGGVFLGMQIEPR